MKDCHFIIFDELFCCADFVLWICFRVGFGAEQIARWLAERADVQVKYVCQFQTFRLFAKIALKCVSICVCVSY